MMNSDLERERKSATFDSEELTCVLFGGRDKVLRKRHLVHMFQSDRNFDGPDHRFLSREDHVKENLRKQVHMVQKCHQLGIQSIEDLSVVNNAVLDSGIGPLSLHFVAFVPPIRLMGDEEQKKKWLGPAERCEIIGCYAQTELGHGSFVRGIETRADYDEKTKEFVLNTPTITSTKWWSGSLGVVATHTVLMAQLYTQGKARGLHPFIVQVRHMDTHKPMPGVDVGDIGPKFGFDTVDNGFLRLKDVRIPKDRLLRKTGEVLDDGTYVKPKNAKLVYGGMLGIRAALPRSGASMISKAAVISIRYSCVRHQSELKPGDPEPQVMDFQTQQHKLFPQLANAYAFTFVGDWLQKFHQGVFDEINQGDFSRLAEDHVLAAGLKAVVNWKAHEGVELCRLSCGGHGYSHASGLPHIYANQVANSTAEGETIVLLLQTAKYLAKCGMDLAQGKKLDPSVTYLGQKYPDSMDLSNPDDLGALVQAFQFRSVKCLERVGKRLQQAMMESGDQNKALNDNSVLLVEAAKAHIEAVIINSFVERIRNLAQSNPTLVAPLSALCQIYGITELLANAGEFILHKYLCSKGLDTLQDRLFLMYQKTRTNAIALVDAFDYDDRTLDSILGRYDGNVYEKLYEWAKDSPLNKDEVHESYHKYLKQLKQAKL